MSNEPITNEELERLEALCTAASFESPLRVIMPMTTAQRNLYNAARAALPKLLAECRSARALLAKADEVIKLQEALIRTFERGQAIDLAALAQARAEREVASRQLQHQRLLAADNVRLRAIIARATDRAAKQLQYYRTDANASGDGTATYHAALCHHYTLMLDSLTEQEPPNEQ